VEQFLLRRLGRRKEIKSLIDGGVKFTLSVLTIDRLGRELRYINDTIHFFTENKIPIILFPSIFLKKKTYS